MTYATTPLGFWHLVKKCFVGYVPVYKRTWFIILLAAFLVFVTALVHAPSPVLWSMNLVLFLVLAFMNAVILHQGDAGLAAQPTSLRESVSVAKSKYFAFLVCYVVLSFCFAFLLLSSLFTFLGALGPNSALIEYLGANPPILPSGAAWLFLLLSLVFLIVIMFLYLAPALVIVQRLGFAAALKQSVVLVKGHWWRVLCVLLVIHVFIAVIFYFIDVIYPVENMVVEAIRTFIFQIIIYPLPVATTLTLLNDLKLRHK